MTTEEAREARPKIEVVRVPSIERASFRPLDGVQLRAAYSHVRVGTYCPGLAALQPSPPSSQLSHPAVTCHKRLVSREIIPKSADHSRKYKKNLGPVSRLLRRRGHHSSGLATKSCDNIYCGQKSAAGNYHEQAFHGRQSNSLDWRMNRSLDRTSTRLDTRKASRSVEQLSKNAPNAKSKLVSLLRRLSPRLPRPTNNKGSTTNICPWLQVEYSRTDDEPDTIDEPESDEPSQKRNLQSPRIDADFERELELSELRKKTLNSEKESIDDLTSAAEDIKNQQSVSKPSMGNNEESNVGQSKQA